MLVVLGKHATLQWKFIFEIKNIQNASVIRNNVTNLQKPNEWRKYMKHNDGNKIHALKSSCLAQRENFSFFIVEKA